MNNVRERWATFKDLELGMLRIGMEFVTQLLSSVLEALDEGLEKPGAEWESIGARPRELDSLFGLKVRYQRRGYRRVGPDGQPEYRWPLDELVGLAPGERFCPLVQHMAVMLATRMSFREAAEVLGEYLQVAVSHEQVHRWVQAAGAAREAEEAAQVQAVLEDGEVPASEGQGADVVVVEADGLFVRLQREEKKVAEVRLGVMHAGWVAEDPAGKRFRLQGKAVWGGVMSGEEFWERGMLRFYRRYEAEKVGRVVVNGDGAEWVKVAPRYLSGAKVYLDRFHRNQALQEGLGFDPVLLAEAHAALRMGELEGLRTVLARAVERAPSGEHAKRVRELRRYLEANWEGLADWRRDGEPVPAGARGLGASEPAIEHVLKRRLGKRGMRWRERGAHHMALLRCMAAEGTLVGWLDGWQRVRWREVPVEGTEQVQRRVRELAGEVDAAAWLAARVPLLATAAGRTELGRRLRALTRLPEVWELVSRGQPMPFRVEGQRKAG